MLKICNLLICVSVTAPAIAQQVDAPEPQPGTISGTVVDVNNDIVPGATVALEGSIPEEHRVAIANDDGFFELHDVKAETP